MKLGIYFSASEAQWLFYVPTSLTLKNLYYLILNASHNGQQLVHCTYLLNWLYNGDGFGFNCAVPTETLYNIQGYIRL